ncbi:hypothetical protein CU098_010014, partial [Rhizopus stolonifer]
MPANTARIIRSKRAARDSTISTSRCHLNDPCLLTMAHGLNHFSNRPGLLSYAEVTNGTRPRSGSPSPVVKTDRADSVERISDAISQSFMGEDSSPEISNHAMSDRRKA